MKNFDLDTNQSSLSFEDLLVDPPRMSVMTGAGPVELSAHQFRILYYFLQNREQVLTRARLLKDLWPDVTVQERTVDSHIASIRKKLRGSRITIKGIYGAGYSLRRA